MLEDPWGRDEMPRTEAYTSGPAPLERAPGRTSQSHLQKDLCAVGVHARLGEQCGMKRGAGVSLLLLEMWQLKVPM